MEPIVLPGPERFLLTRPLRDVTMLYAYPVLNAYPISTHTPLAGRDML